MITIAIPTIGRSKTFNRAFNSALKVDIRLISGIVIINNSQSTEFTSYLEDQISKANDSRIILISHPARVSMAESWNSSLNLIRTAWVLFLHDDDELLDINSYVDLILKKLEEYSNIGFFAFDFKCQYLSQVFRKHGRITYHWPKDMNVDVLINECPKLVSTVLNVEELRGIRGFSNDYGNFLDAIAFFKIYKSAKAVSVPITLGVYHLHEDNESDIHKRAAGYGDFIPQTCKIFFDLYQDPQVRYRFVKSILGFVYPQKQNLVLKVMKRLRII